MLNPEVEALSKATKGLLYTSETDEPLHPFTLEAASTQLTPEKVCQLSQSDLKSKIAEVSLDDFFSTQASPYEGQPPEEKTTADRFSALRKILSDLLTEVKVYRVGDVNVRYLVAGRTKGGAIAGVWTKAVET